MADTQGSGSPQDSHSISHQQHNLFNGPSNICADNTNGIMAVPKGPFRLQKVLMVGSGEYTTGWVQPTTKDLVSRSNAVEGSASQSDKRKGVVCLVLMDMVRRGMVGEIGIVGVNGKKMPVIREHIKKEISDVYKGMMSPLNIRTWPSDDCEWDRTAYKTAMEWLNPGDAVTVFTPDDTHLEIALHAISKRLHVLLAKPSVHSVKDLWRLVEASNEAGVVVAVDYHKRWDPIYQDAVQRIRTLGDLNFFSSYMSQPHCQLDTFRSWAGTSSDVSFYLNSHHVDICCLAFKGKSVPVSVFAIGSDGVATSRHKCPTNTKDTITLVVEWLNTSSGSTGIGMYTASWTAPSNAEVHSQQRFHCLCRDGEVKVDQAHRGYSVTTDEKYWSLNPLYMKYTADEKGYFNGQHGYGYQSLEAWVKACIYVDSPRSDGGRNCIAEVRDKVALMQDDVYVTAILEAGTRSLQHQAPVKITQSEEQAEAFKEAATGPHPIRKSDT
eukprot:Filipodium_phascolosomae@DN1575_c0_g1_i1.p1